MNRCFHLPLSIILLLAVVLPPAPSMGGILDELDAEKRAKLEAGENVLVIVMCRGVWPELLIYRKVVATPRK